MDWKVLGELVMRVMPLKNITSYHKKERVGRNKQEYAGRA
jgi:hypothetical protein